MADVTFTIDGKEVTAPTGTMLVDAARLGGITIPVFCYEPKIGPPVGACRMCLVEIEGVPKLQTGCSTPVKDGMVVYTQTEQVKEAQRGVVEFILANHPLDCPVCDKGGECPLQDNTMGWGPGTSRFTEPKRHFVKPVELSPLIAIDRERCILCYQCVRFSQEVAEEYQLTFMGRGDRTFVGTFDGRPYLAPFSGNIIELCPVGALTSIPYRFSARPWDVEESGSICALCPSQCNIKFTVRDDRVMRVLTRDHRAVDGGWLCDKGRFGYQIIESRDRITSPWERIDGVLVETTWDRALGRVAEGLRSAGAQTAAIAGGQTTNEEGFLLQRLLREGLGSPHIDSRHGGRLDPEAARALAHPDLSIPIATVEAADLVFVIEADPVNQTPILDLMIRKARRRGGAHVAVVASRPTGLDAIASQRLGYAPGGGEALLMALTKALLDEVREAPRVADAGLALDFMRELSLDEPCRAADVDEEDVKALARQLARAERPAVVWAERLATGTRGGGALRALANLVLVLGLHEKDGAGLIEVPDATNARGLREVGCLPNLGPGLTDAAASGMTAAEIASAAGNGEIEALYLLHADPVQDLPDRETWQRALEAASFVVCHADFLSEGIEQHADVILPAEAYAEKDGTFTHPDGRLQRVRPAIGHPGEIRMEWQVLIEISKQVGLDTDWVTLGQVQTACAGAVGFYNDLTLEEIGGRGARWQERPAAAGFGGELGCLEPERTLPERVSHGHEDAVVLETYPQLWASPETERAPALRFARQEQAAAMSAGLAETLGTSEGETIEISLNGTTLQAPVVINDGAHAGTVYLVEGAHDTPANLIAGGGPRIVEARAAEKEMVQ